MNRAERRRQEKVADTRAVDTRVVDTRVVGKNTTPAQRIPAPLPSVAAMKSRLQQATSPTEARQLIDTLVAQGLSPVAGEELTAYAAQYHEGVVALHASSDAEGVAALVDNAHAWADAMIDRSSERERRACRAGCAFCCYLPTVLVTAAEAVRLAAWLQTHCSAEELVEVRRRLLQRDAAATVSPPTKQPRPCALLRDNECMAYAVRPLKCRGWNSLRREACEQAYGQSESQVQVPADAYAFVMGNAVLNGLSDSATRSGLDGGSYDLSDALLRVLDLPDAVQRWRKGERLFDSVR